MATRRHFLRLAAGVGAVAAAGVFRRSVPAGEKMPYAPEVTPSGYWSGGPPVGAQGAANHVVVPGLVAGGRPDLPPPPSIDDRFLVPQVFFHGDRSGERVYFTIDDCSSSRSVEDALAVGASEGVRFTFFALGSAIDANPDLWRRVWAAGHQVEDHTYSHPYLSRLTDAGVRTEIRAGAEAAERALGTGYTARFLRPPAGDGIYNPDPRIPAITAELGMKVAMWDSDSNGWRLYPRTDADAIKYVVDNVFSTLQAGSIVILHAIPTDMVALPALIAGVRERGLRVATLGDGVV